MTTELNKPIQVNPPQHNEERYVLVSQEFPPQEGGMDLADLAIAAWKNRFLFLVSWVILAVITFGVLQSFNTATISTEIRSGQLSKTAVQTLDAIKDQLTTLIFPQVTQDLEKQLQHPISGKFTTDVKKGSDYIKTTIVQAGLSSDQVDTCLKTVMQKWVEYQNEEITKSKKAAQDRMTLITQEIISMDDYIASLNTSKPLEPTEAKRLIMLSESKKQQIFELQQLIQNVEQPIVITPFDYADSGPGRGIKGIAVSAFTGALLAFCLVFAASIVRTAKARLANS